MLYEYKSIYLDSPIVKYRELDILRPDEITQDVSIFIVHGGGWTGGTKESFHEILREFNKHGFLCATTDYRLGKGISIEDQIVDMRHSYDCFISYLKKNNLPEKVFVHGSSAGAHLAGLLTLALPGECGEELTYGEYSYQNEWIKPLGAALQATPVTFEPWEDIFPQIWASMQSIASVSYDVNPDKYKKLSLLSYLRENMPALFFMEADCEHMFPTTLVNDFAEKAEKLGCHTKVKIYKNVEHGFFYALNRWQQKEALKDILDFIKEIS
ncbi:MAG: alpha/beta hydrolase [Planctomycetota bacterium]|jgi:acetyl esterase/lipase